MNIKSSNKFTQLLLVLVLSNALANPTSEEKCSLEDEDCLKRAAQAMLPAFVEGMPELGIKSLDVLHMDDLNIESPSIHYQMRNMEVSGFNETVIDDLSINLPIKLMRLNFHTTLIFNGDYKIDGELFGLPVNGDGRAAFILQKLQMELVILFDISKNDQGKDVLDIKSYFYGSDALDGVYTYMASLYKGDKKKSDVFHEIINTNWRTIVANFGRLLTSQISKNIFDNVQKFMRSRPLEDLAEY